ncbi:MAG: hypothetical protein GVY36_18505 [Verrucomicrobia bacterium]|jgi:hypothetical protein|nr:hypothetical protein [Verrucomicrobiota bacterium]
MHKPKYTIDSLKKVFEEQAVATMPQLKEALGTGVEMTVFRKLKALKYRASYSHRGKYYTLSQIAEFDDRGLWSFGEVHFSRFGTLRKTAAAFVADSWSGYTAAELRRELHVEVKGALLDMLRSGELVRDSVAGEYVYVSPVATRGRRQLMARNDERSAALSELTDNEGEALAHHIRASIILFVSLLDEQQRRLWAGLESMRIGHGGDSAIARLLGITPQTVARGKRELLNRNVEVERVRRPGGGRATVKKNAGNHRTNP